MTRPTSVALGILATALLPALACAQSSNRYEGSTLTGDWGGTRTDLFERGVAFRGDYVGEAMGVVEGGYGETGARYAQQVRVGMDLDMGRLVEAGAVGRSTSPSTTVAAAVRRPTSSATASRSRKPTVASTPG